MTRWHLLLILVVALLWIRHALRARPGARATDGASWDPNAILGVAPGVSRETLTHAYRERLKEYHPDRVAGLGAELQKLAHRKTLDIQRAYDELTETDRVHATERDRS